MLDALRNDITTWCDANLCLDTAAQLDRGDKSPVALYKAMAANGWLGFANIARDPDNLYRLAEVCKIINSYSGVLGNMISVNAACAMMLGKYGTPEQQHLAGALLSGEKLGAFALTEPQAGTDVQGLETHARPVGEHWQVRGEKYLTTGAQVADVLLVVARTNHQVPMNQGTSLLAIPADAPGLSINPMAKMAANGYATCHVTLDNVTVAAEAVVGKPDSAWSALTLGGAVERILVAACCVGLSRTIGEYLYSYAQERHVGGQPLYQLTNIQHRIVDIAIQVRAADALVDQAIAAFIGGRNPINAVAAAKAFAASMQQDVSMAAMEVMGGRAYLQSFPVERWLREGLLALWAGGTNELQKNLMARNPFAP
jgi:alkylation response protein AidB-like acyl-CoA dehydrogenase